MLRKFNMVVFLLTQTPQEDYSAATLSETSAMNEQDVKSLLVNAS